MLGNAQVTGLFPVVYCSDGFCDLTGFSRAEVMQRGCACSFLYGPDTSELVRQQIRKALDEHKEFKAELILYRKSGEGPPGQPASLWRSHPAWHPLHLLSQCSIPIISISPSRPIFPLTRFLLHPIHSAWLLSSFLTSASPQFPIFGFSPKQKNVPVSAGQSYEHICLMAISALPCLP